MKSRRFGTSIGALACSLAVATASTGAIRRVDVNSPGNGPGNLTDWSNAYKHVSDALTAATSGDVI